MAHVQKPDFVFRRNGRVHLNWRRHQFSQLLAAEVSISGGNAGYTMIRGSVRGTGYPIHSPVSPSLPLPASPCANTFQLESTAPLVLDLGRWRRPVVNLTPLQIYPREITSLTIQYGAAGPQGQSGRFSTREKSPSSAESQTPDRPTRSLVLIPNTLFFKMFRTLMVRKVNGHRLEQKRKRQLTKNCVLSFYFPLQQNLVPGMYLGKKWWKKITKIDHRQSMCNVC